SAFLRWRGTSSARPRGGGPAHGGSLPGLLYGASRRDETAQGGCTPHCPVRAGRRTRAAAGQRRAEALHLGPPVAGAKLVPAALPGRFSPPARPSRPPRRPPRRGRAATAPVASLDARER